VVNQRQRSEGAPAEWVDQELREAKARLHKIESDLSQALKQSFGIEGEVRKLMEAMAVSGSVESALQAFREEVRQLRGEVSKVEDRQASIAGRVETIANQRQSESSRDKQELGVLTKRMEAATRVIEQFDSRVKALEDIARHVEEEVAATRLQNAAIDRVMEEWNARTSRSHDASLRLEQEFSRLSGQLERLEKTDEAVAERVAAVIEQVRRLTDRADRLDSLATFADETSEALQKVNYDREQLAQRVSQVEHLISEITSSAEEFGLALARLDLRSQNQLSELNALATRLQDLTDQTKAGLKKVYQVFLRQRRRASEALNQEIKELTAGELHAGD